MHFLTSADWRAIVLHPMTWMLSLRLDRLLTAQGFHFDLCIHIYLTKTNPTLLNDLFFFLCINHIELKIIVASLWSDLRWFQSMFVMSSHNFSTAVSRVWHSAFNQSLQASHFKQILGPTHKRLCQHTDVWIVWSLQVNKSFVSGHSSLFSFCIFTFGV